MSDPMGHLSYRGVCIQHAALLTSGRNMCVRAKTRLEVEADNLVAIDVEFMHVRVIRTDGDEEGREVVQKFQLPAEVCVLASSGDAKLVHTKIDSLTEAKKQHEIFQYEYILEHDGGIGLDDIKGMPLLSAVREEVALAVQGRLVVGHNLAKDLVSLGITEKHIPIKYRRDTMRYPALQNDKGHGRSLAELSLVKLGREIQQSVPHDPCEDAQATLDLYIKYCHYDESLMEYDDLVEYYMSQMLQNTTSD
jgi:hypothetical protein